MRQLYPIVLFAAQAALLYAATFGTVVSKAGGAAYSDIVLDQARGKLYLVNPASNTVDVYSLAQKSFLASVSVPGQPVAEAMSRDGNNLYVTAYTSSVLYKINLNTASMTATIPVPYHPQGVAVGGDERVLITTVGPGSGTTTNTLFLYDPSAAASSLTPINLTVPPPTAATTSTLGRQTLTYSSALIATLDGNYIVGVNGISASERAIFVYETASASVLRAREVVNLSNVLSIAPDHSKFMAGSTLFDFNTLQVIAQENVANSPFAFPSTNNFNLQQNQGGSAFSADGATVYAAFNVNPVTNPASPANATELLLNEPNSLRILGGLTMPENLAGKMVSNAAGDTLYGISDSGFIVLPVGSMAQYPLITVDNTTIFLGNDQCGATANIASGMVNIGNAGTGQLTANVQSYTLPSVAGVTGLGSVLGPGGVTVTLPVGSGGAGIPVFGGGGTGAAGANGGTVTAGATTTSTGTTASSGPNFQLGPNSNGGVALVFSYNPNAAKAGMGTNGESDFLLQSPEAINIAPNIRVFQNHRNAEARGTVFPVAQNISAGESLMDMLYDSNRRRIYITNAGLNRVEVFDIGQQQFLAPIGVGQLPNNMAFGTDGNTLYIANTGGESISIVDLNQMAVTGSVQFPTLPYDSTAAIVTPQAMASTLRGPLVVMSDGTVYEISGNQAIRHALNPVVFGSGATTIAAGTGSAAFRTMASSPEGEYVILFTGTGNAYLYSALIDDFTVGQQIFTTLTGLVGPVAAGPNGQYYIVNGTVLNSSLTPVLNGRSGTGASGGSTSSTRPISAVAAVNSTSYAIFTEPIKSSSTSTATDAGIIQIMNANSGQTTQSANALETSPAVVTGSARSVTNGRTLVIDSTGANAYAITVSGLSVIPMTPAPASLAPSLSKSAVVNLANLGTSLTANEMAAVFGSKLASDGAVTSGDLPLILGGTCVTLNNVAVPLVLSSAGQINFQIPPGLAAGKYPLVVRSIANQVASSSITVTTAKYAPAVMMTASGQAAIYHSNGSLVTTGNPTTRDQTLTIYAAGLGATTGGTVVAGVPSPASTLAVTNPVSVYFGPVGYSQAPVVVKWSGLVPGLVGVYQIDVYVPGTHYEGDAVPVTLEVGGVYSPRTGSNLPTISSH